MGDARLGIQISADVAQLVTGMNQGVKSVAALESELLSLQNNLKGLGAGEFGKLSSAISSVQPQLSALEKASENLKSSLAGSVSTEQFSSLNSSLESVKAKFASLSIIGDQLKNGINEGFSVDSIARFDAQLEGLKAELASLSSIGSQIQPTVDISSALSNIKLLENEFRNATTSFQAQGIGVELNKLKADFDRLRGFKIDVDADVSKATNDIRALSALIANTKFNFDLGGGEGSSESKKLFQVLSDIGGLSGRLQEVNSIIKDLSNGVRLPKHEGMSEADINGLIGRLKEEQAALIQSSAAIKERANAILSLPSIKPIADKQKEFTADLIVHADLRNLSDEIHEFAEKNGTLTINSDTTSFNTQVDALKQKIESISQARVNINAPVADFNKITQNIEAVKADIASIGSQKTINVTGTGLDKLNSDISEAKNNINSLSGKEVVISADVTGIAEVGNNLTALQNKLSGLTATDAFAKLKTSVVSTESQISFLSQSADRLKASLSGSLFPESVNKFNSSLESVKSQFVSLSDLSGRLNFAEGFSIESLTVFDAQLEKLKADLAGLSSVNLGITGTNEVADFTRQIDLLKSKLDSITLERISVQTPVNELIQTSQAIEKTKTEFISLGQASAATGFDISKAFESASQRINASIDKAVAQALGGFSQLKSFKPDFGVLSFDTSKVIAGIEQVKAEINSSFGDFGAVNLDSSQVLAAAEQLKVKLESLHAQIPVTVTSTGLEKLNADIAATKAQLNSLIVKNLKVDVDATEALQKLSLIKGDIREVSGVPFKFNTADAIKSLTGLQSQVNRLDSSLKTTGGLSSFHASLGKSTAAVQNLQRTDSGLNNFYSNLVAGNNRAANSFNRLPGAVNTSSFAILNFGRVIQDAPFGILGIANNFNPLLESLQRASVAAKETGTSLSKNLLGALSGPAGIGLAVSAVSSLLIVFGDKLFGTAKSLSSAEIEARKFTASLADIKVGIDAFFSSLEFDISLDKLKNKLKFGDKAEIFNIGLDKSSADQIVSETNDQISKATLRIAEIINNSSQLLSASGQKLAKTFFSSLQTGVTVDTEGLSKADKKIFDILNENATTIGALNEQNTKARRKSAESDVQIELQKAEDLKRALEKQKDAFEKFQNDIIAKAKFISDKLKENFVVPSFEITPFTNKNELINQAQKFLNDISEGIIFKARNIKAEFIGGETSAEAFLASFRDAVAKTPLEIRMENIKLDISKLSKSVSDKVKELNAQIGKSAADASKSLSDSLKGVFAEAFQSFGEDIGTAITGGGDLFKSVFAIIGSGVQALGKQIITLGVAALALKKSLAALLTNPALAIAAGIALTAIGTAMKKTTGIKGFAGGGFVSGPGGPKEDRIPALLSNGEFIVNAAATRKNFELLKFINSGFKVPKFDSVFKIPKFAEGGLVSFPAFTSNPPTRLQSSMRTDAQPQVILLNSRVRGRDQILQIKREERSQRLRR